MHAYQREFIEFARRSGALRFGEFTLKSGRLSPYFFNTGTFDRGSALSELGRHYADAIVTAGFEFDLLFGPAYKGIPLGTAIAIALFRDHGRDVPLSFNRKEAKAHGEGGTLVGAPVAGRVVIVDDVITDGASKRESVEMLRAAGGQATAVLIALDRMERGGTDDNLSAHSAVEDFERDYGLPVISIATLADLLQYLQTNADPALKAHFARVVAYRERYGV